MDELAQQRQNKAMNHKRGKPKNARNGCLMCKPHKMNGAGGGKLKVSKTGFGKLRGEIAARSELKDASRGRDLG